MIKFNLLRHSVATVCWILC